VSVSNICDRCSGQKTIYYDVVMMPGKSSIAQYNPGIMKLCTCPIEHPKHDGNLDTYKSYMHADAEYHQADWTQEAAIHIHGGYGDDESMSIYLDAQQALSLLTWLRQEETALEELAKEQES